MNCKVIKSGPVDMFVFCTGQAHDVFVVKKGTFAIRDGSITHAISFCPFCGAQLPIEAPKFKKCVGTNCTRRVRMDDISGLCSKCFAELERKAAGTPPEEPPPEVLAPVIKIGDYRGKP